MTRSAFPYTTTAGFALAGAAVLLAAAPDSMAPVEGAQVQLASFNAAPASLSYGANQPWWISDSEGPFGPALATPAVPALAQTNIDLSRPIIGEGGWLIGDGADAAANCVGAGQLAGFPSMTPAAIDGRSPENLA